MLAYAIRRVALTIPILLIGTFLVFVLVSVAGDPLANLATCLTCDQSAYDRLIDLYSLDEPIPVRYLHWITDAIRGDLGTAVTIGSAPVTEVILERARNTALLAVPAFLFTAILSVSLGVYSAVRQYSVGDYLLTGFSFFGVSMPTFFFGLLLQVVFGVWLVDWLGVKPFYVTGMRLDSFVEYVRSAALPVMTLMLVNLAVETRFERAAMLEVTGSDYVRTARSKGLPERTVVFRHALRNALIPLVTIWALNFAGLLGGSIITETIYAWPGLGPLFLRAINGFDLDLVMGIVMFVAVLTVVFNLIADLLYGVLDPRIRYD